MDAKSVPDHRRTRHRPAAERSGASGAMGLDRSQFGIETRVRKSDIDTRSCVNSLRVLAVLLQVEVVFEGRMDDGVGRSSSNPVSATTKVPMQAAAVIAPCPTHRRNECPASMTSERPSAAINGSGIL